MMVEFFSAEIEFSVCEMERESHGQFRSGERAGARDCEAEEAEAR